MQWNSREQLSEKNRQKIRSSDQPSQKSRVDGVPNGHQHVQQLRDQIGLSHSICLPDSEMFVKQTTDIPITQRAINSPHFSVISLSLLPLRVRVSLVVEGEMMSDNPCDVMDDVGR